MLQMPMTQIKQSNKQNCMFSQYLNNKFVKIIVLKLSEGCISFFLNIIITFNIKGNQWHIFTTTMDTNLSY